MNLKVPCHVIIAHVAKEFGVTYSDIVSRRRGPEILDARRAAYGVVSEMRKDLPILTIARVFRGRDHSTVLNGIKQSKVRREKNQEFAKRCDTAKDNAYRWRPPESQAAVGFSISVVDSRV